MASAYCLPSITFFVGVRRPFVVFGRPNKFDESEFQTEEKPDPFQ